MTILFVAVGIFIWYSLGIWGMQIGMETSDFKLEPHNLWGIILGPFLLGAALYDAVEVAKLDKVRRKK